MSNPLSSKNGISAQGGYKRLSLGGSGMSSSPSSLVSGSGNRDSASLSAAFDLIKEEEGLRTEAYQDQTGTWTIGFGNTMINGRPVRPGDKISTTQAQQMMRDSVIKNYTTFADRVNAKLNPSQFAALTSFEYNLGSGVWQQPTGKQILSLVQGGDFDKAGRLMLQYNKSRHPQTRVLQVNPVLSRRRKREAQMLSSDSGLSNNRTVATARDARVPDETESETATPATGRGYVPLSSKIS